MTHLQQLRNEVKTYIPNITRQQFTYIILEHTLWPHCNIDMAKRQIARYMFAIDKVSAKSVGERKNNGTAKKLA